MHALQSLAHRAPPATRTRVRWQPYNPMPTTSCSIRSPSLHTPVSISSTPLKVAQPQPPTTAHTSKEVLSRDPHKAKFTLSLVDQAVKSISEIWRPQDIPPVFISPSRASVALGPALDSNPPLPRYKNNQLPTPPSPSTRPPSPPLSTVHLLSTGLPESPISNEKLAKCASTPASHLVPIRSFVHEVLRRSRTSGSVLQTALCYLEAIRPKIPHLVQQEQCGEFVDESVLNDRISRATDIKFTHGEESDSALDQTVKPFSNHGIIDTVQVSDDSSIPVVEPPIVDSSSVSQGLSTAPSPRLPSPLLCPRRAFLACLILASKFTQDKCYSNRAWAKLSNLPPREISRCERALGEALEWRLWVGKRPLVPSPPSSSKPSLVRSQSMTSLMDPIPSQIPFLVPVTQSETPNPSSGGLRRCSTLPAEAYSLRASRLPNSVPCSMSPEVVNNDDGLPSQFTSVDTAWTKPMGVSSTIPPSIFSEVQSQIPSPDTPGLTYSPSSTESSSGDQTIQISNFFDDGLVGSNVGSTPWTWETTECKLAEDTFHTRYHSPTPDTLDGAPWH